jgi:tetratricopeptide (TPR) repeat protein
MNTTDKARRASKNGGSAHDLERLVAQLKEEIAARHIESGIARLKAHHALLGSLSAGPSEAALLGYLAQWVDIGFRDNSLLEPMLERFSKAERIKLPLSSYVYLRIAQGLVAMTAEATDEAIAHFDFVLGLAEEFQDKESLAIVNFWKARCLRKRGEYDESLVYTVKARDLALELEHTRMAAVMQVLESWLLFQKGKLKEAVQILHAAEQVLRETDDYVTLGNIQSSYGRIASREGRHDEAIDHFTKAIGEYKKRDSQHRNLARTLANIALAKRMIALQLRKKIDAEAERRRKAAVRGVKTAVQSRMEYRLRLQRLSQEAFSHLKEAAAIYSRHPTHHGTGTVHLICGYLHLDNAEYERADQEASAAFELGNQKNDYILMGRARILQCIIENARVDEEIGEGSDPGYHARHAQSFIREAIEMAKHTQDRRLLAQAHIWEGFTHCNAFFEDGDAARQSYDAAVNFLQRDHSISEWQDLQMLRSRIHRTGSVDSTLRAWSQGFVGDKTFRQVTDQFAELVIPKVWKREGCKVSRVATKLSISPKKVRRILQRAGSTRKPQ